MTVYVYRERFPTAFRKIKNQIEQMYFSFTFFKQAWSLNKKTPLKIFYVFFFFR